MRFLDCMASTRVKVVWEFEDLAGVRLTGILIANVVMGNR